MQTDTALVPMPTSAVSTAPTSMVPITFEQVAALADHIVRSRMFGVDNQSQAITLMMLCQAEGLHPMQAVRRYHLINGRPAMKADALLAEFQTRGGIVRWTEYSDTACTGIFSHPQSPEPLTVQWTIEMARKANLANKPGPWQQFPRAMLRARVISEGVRTCLPAVCVGIYTEEECRDMPPIAPDAGGNGRQGNAQGQSFRRGTPEPAPAMETIQGEVISTPAVPPSRVARDRFDAVARANDLVFESGADRGTWANLCLGRATDSREPFSPDDWLRAAKALPGVVTSSRMPAPPAREEYAAEEPEPPAYTGPVQIIACPPNASPLQRAKYDYAATAHELGFLGIVRPDGMPLAQAIDALYHQHTGESPKTTDPKNWERATANLPAYKARIDAEPVTAAPTAEDDTLADPFGEDRLPPTDQISARKRGE